MDKYLDGSQNNSVTPDIGRLIDESFSAKSNAYCPYSHFPVGAAILCPDGTIFRGCNMENLSYGLTNCAERVAIGAAIAAGYRQFTAIAISSNVRKRFVYPCGACRQVLAEFGLDWKVYLTKPDKSYVVKTTKDLLPEPFDHDSLMSVAHNNDAV